MKQAYFHQHSPFDQAIDAVFIGIGIQPKAIETFLTTHKRESRVAANLISVARVGLGILAIHKYEQAREKNDRKGMSTGVLALAVILATDGIDGYLCRKAHIDESKTGKIIDSACDVALRVLIAGSSLIQDKDWIDKLRIGAEVGVGLAAVPDMFAGKYSSTDAGKVKTVSDGLTVLLTTISDSVSSETNHFKQATKATRLASTLLALADAFTRHFENLQFWETGT